MKPQSLLGAVAIAGLLLMLVLHASGNCGCNKPPPLNKVPNNLDRLPQAHMFRGIGNGLLHPPDPHMFNDHHNAAASELDVDTLIHAHLNDPFADHFHSETISSESSFGSIESVEARFTHVAPSGQPLGYSTYHSTTTSSSSSSSTSTSSTSYSVHTPHDQLPEPIETEPFETKDLLK
jgi:hypothetical protein